MSSFYVDQRTKTVVSVLLRIECYVWQIARATIARLIDEGAINLGETESPSKSLNEAKKIRDFDSSLGKMGVGLSRWNLLVPNSSAKAILSSLVVIIGGLEKFRGSTQGINQKGKVTR